MGCNSSKKGIIETPVVTLYLVATLKKENEIEESKTFEEKKPCHKCCNPEQWLQNLREQKLEMVKFTFETYYENNHALHFYPTKHRILYIDNRIFHLLLMN